MQLIIRYLKGEFGLLKTFWLGLILCGALISVISHNLEIMFGLLITAKI